MDTFYLEANYTLLESEQNRIDTAKHYFRRIIPGYFSYWNYELRKYAVCSTIGQKKRDCCDAEPWADQKSAVENDFL